MGRRALAGVVLAAVVSLSGCGGPMQPDELKRSIGTLESSAAEGALLANHVAHDRTKATFARVHASELTDAVEHEAEKLNDAEAEAEAAATKDRAIDVADQISAALGRIQTAPGDEAEGGTAERELAALTEKAAQLAEGL
jgi:hypothetical protein